jgi:ethanolamine utilization protein EutA
MHDAPWEHHHQVGDPVSGHDDVVVWTTVGFDVGSSTSQLAFSRIVLSRHDDHYVVSERSLLHESKVILTPYAGAGLIDGAGLKAFVEDEYQAAGLHRSDVDTGAVILTGLALSKSNARAIADATADDGGKFVSVAAGDLLEARLAAQGAGAPAASQGLGGLLVHVDVGGGTTKLSAWEEGELVGLAAIDIGARLLTTDADGKVTRIEPPAAQTIEEQKLTVRVGEPLSEPAAERLAGCLARDALRYASVLDEPPRGPPALRTAPLFDGAHAPVKAVIFSGGVSEYVYGRETRTFGDLGLLMGRALAEAVAKSGVQLIPFDRGIRATVLGVSQHTAQLSGNTVYVSDEALLPLRNRPVLFPKVDLGAEALDHQALSTAIDEVLSLAEEGAAPALAFHWQGSATYDRLGRLAGAVTETLGRRLGPGQPIVVVVQGDVAGVLGARIAETLGGGRGVVCLDGVHLHEFDHIDVGEFAPKTRALPVVVKSLLFAKTETLKAHEKAPEHVHG